MGCLSTKKAGELANKLSELAVKSGAQLAAGFYCVRNLLYTWATLHHVRVVRENEKKKKKKTAWRTRRILGLRPCIRQRTSKERREGLEE